MTSMATRVRVGFRWYRIGQLRLACTRDLGLPFDTLPADVANAIRERRPEIRGTDAEMIVWYARIIQQLGVRVGRKHREPRRAAKIR